MSGFEILCRLLVIGAGVLLLRHFVCWFFKINQMVKLLEEIHAKVRAEETKPVHIPWWKRVFLWVKGRFGTDRKQSQA